MPSYFYHILLELLIAGGGNNNSNNNSTPTLAADEHGPVAIQYENDNPDTFSPFSPSSSHPHPHRHPSQLRLLLDGSDKNDIDITLRGFCDALQPFRNGHKRRARGSAGKGARGGDDWDCHNNQNNRNSNRHLRRKNFRGGNSNGNSGGGEIDRDLVGGGGEFHHFLFPCFLFISLKRNPGYLLVGCYCYIFFHCGFPTWCLVGYELVD